ncbi:MAG TPA: hypothetical protein VGI70_06220, partial [Polyangiales bacterium]
MSAWSWPLAMLFDSDSYYHLAVARAYTERGPFSELSWARFSAMQHGFGDKELLFHWLVALLVKVFPPLMAAKVAIAALVASIVSSIALGVVEALGPVGIWLALSLIASSIAFGSRIIRLRPELLSLLLLLASVRALARRRYAWLLPLSAAFALAYTAWQALFAICVLAFLCVLWVSREARFRILIFPLIGIAAGLMLHPQFPHNLRIWYLQNVVFWRYTDSADVGTEILPLGFARFFAWEWPLLFCLPLMAAAMVRTQSSLTPERRETAFIYSAVAIAFGLLFSMSARFVVYALPFGLLALAWQVRLHGFELPERFRARPRAPRNAFVFALACTIVLPRTAAALTDVVDRGGCVWPALRRQLEALGRAMPEGAKVAAPWAASDDYIYFAPQGRYLNLLDPLFMRARDPRAYEVQRRLFAAQLIDVPLALRRDLDSDFIAFDVPALPELAAQLASDPRVVPLIAGGHALYRVEPDRDRAFVLSLRVDGSRERLRQGEGMRYPRATELRAREVEGFVDSARVAGAGRCLW